MAVIESKGNGYALYGGVKLLEFSALLSTIPEEVWPYVRSNELPCLLVLKPMSEAGQYLVFLSEEPVYVIEGLIHSKPGGIVCMADYYSIQEPDVFDWGTNGLNIAPDIGKEWGYEIEWWTPVFANYDFVDLTDDSILLAVSEDPIPLDGMNVIEWDGVNEPPFWDGSRDGHGMWDYGDGTIRLAPYAETSNAVAVIGGEVYTYLYIDTGYWEVYESFEAYEESDYERRGAYSDREYGICACEHFDDEGNHYLTSLIAYTPIVDYTITYKNMHGASPSAKIVTVNEGEGYTLTANDLPIASTNRWEYSFVGWSKTPTKEDYVAEGYEINSDITLYAVWSKDVTITYHSKHGEVPLPVNFTMRGTHFLEYWTEDYLPELEADGFVFKGWSTRDDIISYPAQFESGDLDLYAIWEVTIESISYIEYMVNPKYCKYPFRSFFGWIIQRDKG